MITGEIELVWIDRREILKLRADADPSLLDTTFDRLREAHRSGEPLPVFGRRARVLAFEPPLRFIIEDAAAVGDPDEGKAP